MAAGSGTVHRNSLWAGPLLGRKLGIILYGSFNAITMQDRKEARQSAAELCHAFAHGRCRFGDGCRFSHDVAAYLAAKAPELPGRCPFSAADSCPHGKVSQNVTQCYSAHAMVASLATKGAEMPRCFPVC